MGSPNASSAAHAIEWCSDLYRYAYLKIIYFLGVLAALGITATEAQTCHETVRDSSGRVVKQVERRQAADGTTHTVERDSTGRIIGTSRSTSSGGTMRTD